jgi:hypothetical protein
MSCSACQRMFAPEVSLHAGIRLHDAAPLAPYLLGPSLRLLGLGRGLVATFCGGASTTGGAVLAAAFTRNGRPRSCPGLWHTSRGPDKLTSDRMGAYLSTFAVT